ncbi:MAG: type IV secretion system protein [Coxiellaceae bacterium]|nr:type IV secretion system protein [Coxiellaceae bacterium]
MIVNSSNVIEALYTELHVLLADYVFDAYGALAAYIKLPLALAITLYICLLGVAITQGWVKLSLAEFGKSALKIAFIYMAAINWAWFSENVIGLISHGAGHISAILTSATPMPVPHTSGEGINAAMQLVLNELTAIGMTLWHNGSWHNFGPMFSALLVWGFGYAMLLVSLFELMLAKIMLAVLFATAPLFISFTLFKPTQGFFERWLGACVGYALIMVFVAAMLSLVLTIAQWVLQQVYIPHIGGTMIFSAFVPMVLVGFVGVGLILKSAQLAQAIGGTVMMVAVSTNVSASIANMLFSGFKSVLPKKSSNKSSVTTKTESNQAEARANVQMLYLDIITVKGA